MLLAGCGNVKPLITIKVDAGYMYDGNGRFLGNKWTDGCDMYGPMGGYCPYCMGGSGVYQNPVQIGVRRWF